jgi:hypothetical protein
VIYLCLRQTIEDYARWKEGFDNHIVARQASGATDETYILRNVDDPNEITVVLGWRDLAQARAFSQSVSLQIALQKAGVSTPPEIRFLETVG